MTAEQIQRRKLIKGTLILVICGVLYYCFVKITGIGIPCVFRLLTGLKCPGCGITTMLMSLATGDIRAAYEANRFLLITLPFLLFEMGFFYYQKWMSMQQPRWNEILLVVYVAMLIAFGVLRNLTCVGW